MAPFLPPPPTERCTAVVPEAGGRYAGRCRHRRVGASNFCADHETEAQAGQTPSGRRPAVDVVDLARDFLHWSRNDPQRWTTAFLAWADSRQLSEPLRREVRIALLRRRNFGGKTPAGASG